MKKILSLLGIFFISIFGTSNLLVNNLLDNIISKVNSVRFSLENREMGIIRNDEEYIVAHTIMIDLNSAIDGNFNNFFKYFASVSLDNFIGHIYLFSSIDVTETFKINIPNVVLETESWNSDIVTIASASEDDALAHIEGKILVLLKVACVMGDEETIRLWLDIIVQANAWSTPNDGHVWFRTGDSLVLNSR